MQQIFILWSSSVSGVWSTFGGRAGLVKQKISKLMFEKNWVWEKCEVFNLWYAWATAEFVRENCLPLLRKYKRWNWKTIVLINIWGNNIKARWKPDGYVCSPEEYKKELESLLNNIQKEVDDIIFVSSGYVDEAKTTPKLSPLDWEYSYFYNDRKILFNNITENLCKELWIEYIGVDMSPAEWVNKYCYKDWLHSNDKWHRYLFDKVWEKLKNMIDL